MTTRPPEPAAAAAAPDPPPGWLARPPARWRALPPLATRLDLDAVEAYPAGDEDRLAWLRLDINEDPRGAPAHVVATVRAGLTGDAVATYDSPAALERAWAHVLGVDAAQLLACNGGDQALELVLRAYLGERRAVVTHAPSFDMVALWTALHRGKLWPVPLRPAAPGDLRFDVVPFVEAIEAAAATDGLGAVMVISPNNPTASVVRRDELLAIAGAIVAVAERTGAAPVPLIVDETYIDFGGVSAVELVAEVPFLFVQRSMSKGGALAGLRLGCLVADAREIRRLRGAAEPYRLNRAAALAGLATLRERDGGAPPRGTLPSWLRARHAEIVAARQVLADGLRSLGLGVGPEEANFLLVHAADAHGALTASLRRDGILVRDRHGRHPLLDGCVRIGVGDGGQVARTLAAVRKALGRQVVAPAAVGSVLFDLDGTLIDVRDSCLAAILHTVQTLLVAAGAADLASAVGAAAVAAYKARGLNNDWDCAAAMLADRGVVADRDVIVACHQRFYRGERWDGAIATERWLVDPAAARRLHGWRIGVVTGRPREEALYALAREDAPLPWPPVTPQAADRPAALLAVVAAMEDMPRQKPAPDGVVAACAQLAVEPAQTWYVGDSVDDMRAARAAGAHAIAVLGPGEGWGDGGAERLALAGATIVCKDVQEAIAWLVT